MKTSLKKREDIVCLIIGAFIIAWPLLHSFFGIDLGDTGYYVYQYEHPRTDNIPYSTYLATLIGGTWLRLFPGLGLWGLNFLEVILEYITCAVVFITFRKVFGRWQTLLGLSVCIVYINTYVNIFNFHQLSMLLCVSLICFLYNALRNNQCKWALLSGICGGLAIATRMPSVLTLLSVLCIIYWAIFIQKNVKDFWKITVSFIAGFVVSLGCILAVLKKLGVLERVINDIFRLNAVGNSSGVYAVDGMITNLIKDTVHTSVAALLFFGCTIAVMFLGVVLQKYIKNSILRNVLYALAGIAAFVGMLLANYYVISIPNFAQLRKLHWFTYGICLLPGIVLIIRGMLSKEKEAKHFGLIALLATDLMYLVFVGANTRLKHCILGLWIFMPMFVYLISKIFLPTFSLKIKNLNLEIPGKQVKIATVIMCMAFSVELIHFAAITNNFDTTKRWEMNTGIDHPKLKMLKTTPRRAEAVEEVVNAVNSCKTGKDDMLLVYGNGLMLYSLTELDAYVRPWITGSTYSVEDLQADLATAKEVHSQPPIVVFTKTDMYLGFEEEDYEELRKKDESVTYGGKKDIVNQMIMEQGLSLVFENDYFSVYSNVQK